MTKNFIIPLIVFPFDVMVSIGETDADLFKKLKRHGIEDTDFEVAQYTDDSCMGRYALFPGNQTLIRIRKSPKTPEEYGTLQHEIFHAVSCILDRMGMELVILKSDEAYGYLTGYLTEEIYKKL